MIDASSWPKADRVAAVDWVFNHPHPFLKADVAWLEATFDQDEQRTRNIFINAPRLAVVLLDERPLYLFCVNEANNLLTTASEERLDKARLFLTRALMKFSRSPAGHAMFKGVIAAGEVGELESGVVPLRWAYAMKFQPYAEVDQYGQRFRLFSFRGA